MELFYHAAVLVIAFAVLMKSASFFVDGAVGLATALNIPKLIVGIVLVSMATTAAGAPPLAAETPARATRMSEVRIAQR